jgi:hypothetical protein
MRREVVLGMSCAIVLAGAVAARALDERELGADELRTEMIRNHALAAYIERNGPPDLAESRFLSDEPPWDDHEVTLYYLDSRKEIAFTRAWILGWPEVHLAHYERPLTDEQVRALTSRARAHPLEVAGGGPVERAELAAQRAEDAAGRVETAAGSAERAADRAEAVASKMEGAFHRALRK